MELLLRIDGQNLGQTIADTGELSVLRGGGLALLYAPERLFARLQSLGHKVRVVYYGSSEGVAYVAVPDGKPTEEFERELHGLVRDFLNGQPNPSDDDLTKNLLPILPFLTVSFATTPASNDFTADHNSLVNQNRAHQYQSLTVDLLPPVEEWAPGRSQDKPCQVDRTRPISKELAKGGNRVPVSASVYFRQKHGRKLRQRFYQEELGRDQELPTWGGNEDVRQALLRGDENYRFSAHFGEIALPPHSQDMKVPLKLQGKMAVLYADGNQFGKIKRELCKQPEDYQAFSLHVQRKRRQLLSKVVELVSGVMGKDPDNPERWVIPMETLLWGGDEFCFVLPAWSAIKVVEAIAPMLAEGWDWQGQDLTHAMGLVFCHHKTPIQEIRRLAENLAGSAKGLCDEQGRNIGRLGNYLQAMVLMGMDPPAGGVKPFRDAHYQCAEARPFSFDLSLFDQTMATMKEFLGLAEGPGGKISEGVPPSQLFKIRGLALDAGLLNQPEDAPAFQAWLKVADEKLKEYADSRGKPFSWQHLKGPHMAYDSHYPLMPLFHLLHLGEYVEPFLSRGGVA